MTLLGVAQWLGPGAWLVLYFVCYVLLRRRPVARKGGRKHFVVESRRVNQLRSSIDDIVTHTRTEMDSHADTCVVGDNALIIHDHERHIAVTGYDHGRSKTYKIVDAVIGYDDPETGDLCMLVCNQAIHIPGLKHNLLCPMQLRMNDVLVNETPKFLAVEPTDEDHAILITKGDHERLTIPLSLEGVTSYFQSFKPSAEQYKAATEGVDCLHLTYRDPEWDPHDIEFSRQEDAMVGSDGMLLE